LLGLAHVGLVANHWGKTGFVDITTSDTMPNGAALWQRWNEILGTPDVEALKQDGGEYLGFVRLVAAKQMRNEN